MTNVLDGKGPTPPPQRLLTFNPRAQQPYPITHRADYTRPTCFHRAATIDVRRRRLECSTCAAPLDAFDYLARLAQQWDRRVLEERSYHELNAALAALLEAKGRLHLKPSGATVYMPDPAGVDDMTSSRSMPPLHAVESALKTLKQRQEWRARKDKSPR